MLTLNPGPLHVTRIFWIYPPRSATVRSFRLVATIAAMQLVTSLIRVISTLMDARDTAQRQLEAEQKRKGNKVLLLFVQATSPNEDCARLFCCGPVHVSVMPSSCRGGLQAQSAFDPKSICRRQRQEYTFLMQAAAERTSALRRTIDQAHHRATELKDHIKVWSHQTPDTRPAAHCVEMRTRASSLVSRFNAHSLQILWTAP